MKSSIALVVSALFPALAAAQVAPTVESPDGPGGGWSVGAGAIVRDSEYAGEDVRILPLPYFSYEGERFFVRGLSAGVRFHRSESLEIVGFIAARADGFDADDLGAEELAERGVNRDLLEDRDHSADVGAALTWRTAAGEFELDVRADVSDASGGYFATADYRYPISAGRVVVAPGFGVSHLSADAADYYYGTLDEEVARGVSRYRPGSVVVPYGGVSVRFAINDRWQALARAQYRFLPDEIQDSPLVDADADAVGIVMFSLSRRF
jgi:outer membrane protein